MIQLQLPKSNCSLCPRLVDFRELNQKNFPNFHNGPVKSFGSLQAQLIIVGLAPGLHGANKTGKVFSGDFSGNTLRSCLESVGFISPHQKNYPYITNAVKCYPPNNNPKAAEIQNCSKYLKDELSNMSNLSVIIALGKISHNAILKYYQVTATKFKFGHGNIYNLHDGVTLIDSYHCSKLNINTKKITRKMLINILNRAKNVS